MVGEKLGEELLRVGSDEVGAWEKIYRIPGPSVSGATVGDRYPPGPLEG
jgi:hypothetical protein